MLLTLILTLLDDVVVEDSTGRSADDATVGLIRRDVRSELFTPVSLWKEEEEVVWPVELLPVELLSVDDVVVLLILLNTLKIEKLSFSFSFSLSVAAPFID